MVNGFFGPTNPYGNISNIQKKKPGLGAGITKVPAKTTTAAADKSLLEIIGNLNRVANEGKASASSNFLNIPAEFADDFAMGKSFAGPGASSNFLNIPAVSYKDNPIAAAAADKSLLDIIGKLNRAANEGKVSAANQSFLSGEQKAPAAEQTLADLLLSGSSRGTEEEQLQRRDDLLKKEREQADALKKSEMTTGTESDDSKETVDSTDSNEVNQALDKAGKDLNEPLSDIVQDQEKSAGLPSVGRFLPSEADIAGMQQRAFSGTLTPEDLTSLFESETRLTNEIGRLRQEASQADAELIRLGFISTTGKPGDLLPMQEAPTMADARESLLAESGDPRPDAAAQIKEKDVSARYEMLTKAYNEERGPEAIDELRRQSTQGGLAAAYETKRLSLQDLRDRLDDRNRLRRQELPLEAERAQVLQGLFQQLFPAADPTAFAPIGQVGRVSVPGVLEMLVEQQRRQQEQQQQQQLGGLGQSLAQALGMPEELAGIGQAAGLQPGLLGTLLQQLLSQQGQGLQRPTLQYR
jgi:hypothetical protein